MSYDANAQTFTSADLLARVRTRSVMLNSAVDWTDQILLREISDSIHSFVSWALSRSGGGRLVETYNRSATAALSSSYRAATEYELPPLAVGDTIEGVTWVTADGQSEVRLGQISQAEGPTYDTPTSNGAPAWYSLLSGRIRIYPQPTEGGIVRFNYQRRHPELIIDAATDVGTVVTATDAGGGYVLFSLVDTSPFAIGDFVDLVSNKYPYRPLFTSLYCDNSSSCRLYLPFSYLSTVDVSGMRVMRAGQSPYVHIPLELRPALIEHASAKVMRTIGDMVGAQAADAMARDELARIMELLAPRTKADRPKAVGWNSLMRRSIRYRW